jgi:hypothetical protein
MANAQQDFVGVILDISSSQLVWVKPDEEEAEKTHGRHPRCQVRGGHYSPSFTPAGPGLHAGELTESA